MQTGCRLAGGAAAAEPQSPSAVDGKAAAPARPASGDTVKSGGRTYGEFFLGLGSGIRQ